MSRRLTWLVAAAFALPGCKDDRNDPETAEKVIEEAKDEAASARDQIQEKQEDLVEGQGDSARDRASFIDATEQELSDLDRRIQELRAHVQERGNQLAGEARRDLRQDLSELEATRNEARAALDRFKTQTGAQMGQVQQATEEAMAKLRRAVKDADQQLDPDRDPGDPGKEVPPPTATGP